jgi:uncharacterized protein YbjT (DUF2867 family)
MRIAVTTPTGNVGQHVVPMLVRAGLRPVVLVRDPERLDPALRAEVDAVAADQRDQDAVVAATADVDALFWVDPPSAGEDPHGDYDRATASVARAVRENGIARTVFQSSVGAEKRHGAGEIDALARTEEALDATGAAVTHLRCGFFFTNLMLMIEGVRAGEIPIILPPDAPMAWVAPRDIAEVAVTRLLNADWSGRGVQAVHGPADLTWSEAAEIVSVAIGRKVQVNRISDEAMRAQMLGSGMTEGLVDAVIGMSTGLRDDFIPEQRRSVHTTTETTLAAWAYDVLRPMV